MKRILSLTVAAFVLLSFSSASDIKLPVAQGKTNSALGIYTIDKAGKFEMIKGDALRAYEIRYENSPDTVMVAVDDSKKGLTRYLVISDNLVIEYIAGPEYFGVRIIDDRFAKEGFSTPQQNLDVQEYYHQKLITGKPLTETEHLCLISVYFPKLIKDYHRIYATKD
ncbi:MAG TPA: hypothetical protein ENH59_00375 [Bacteroidetes bacterium]|nr:hypothetical protein [Bacteroidota bacterium]